MRRLTRAPGEDAPVAVGLGIAVLLLACVPGTIGIGLLTGGGVARWAARHKLFA